MNALRSVGCALLICSALIGCQGQASSGLDPDERQWIAEETVLPPTGGPMSTTPASAALSLAEHVVPPPAVVAPVVASPVRAVAPVPPEVLATPPAPKRASFPQTSVAEQVRVSMYPSTIITCDGPLEVDYEHAKAVFHDNVHVTDERGEMFADIMEVFFTPTHEISQVISTGHVRIVRGEDTAYCDRAVYLQQEGRVLMTGEPKLVLFPETREQAAGQRPSRDGTATRHE